MPHTFPLSQLTFFSTLVIFKQAGTEHVTSIITGIAGAVMSAPAAALEALSPTAAARASDGVAFLSSKMPAMSLQDASNSAQNLAGSAYNAVPEGTAATLKGYAGAAISKAQEVLPPALGGSPVSYSIHFAVKWLKCVKLS